MRHKSLRSIYPTAQIRTATALARLKLLRSAAMRGHAVLSCQKCMLIKLKAFTVLIIVTQPDIGPITNLLRVSLFRNTAQHYVLHTVL